MSFEQKYGKQKFTFAQIDRLLAEAIDDSGYSQKQQKKAYLEGALEKFRHPDGTYSLSTSDIKSLTNQMQLGREEGISTRNLMHMRKAFEDFNPHNN